MAATASSYSITMRLYTDPDHAVVGQVATSLAQAGGVVTAIDVLESNPGQLKVDVTCSASDEAHSKALIAVCEALDGVNVHKVSDRTFLLHLGGKIEVTSKVALKTRDDLSLAYTPGVGRVSSAIAENPEDVWRLTVKGNSVAVVTDGSAVLGLGNIGPGAALPVMEGKAALFKRFANIDAWPICLATQDPDEIVRAVELIAPVFGGINLEDIAAPKCFEIEARLKERLDIPVFHDDQHGTAIVTLAALENALKIVGKQKADLKVVVAGVGAAGVAVSKILMNAGVVNIIGCDRQGAVHTGREGLNKSKQWFAENTNPDGLSGSIAEVMPGADVFIGLSGPDLITRDDVIGMATDPIVFAMANPDPEIRPELIQDVAAVIATGRSDFPNQINNVLAFPGIFRGALDAGARRITENMKVAAAEAIAETVKPEDLCAEHIIPSVFDPLVASAVAKASAAAARADGVCR